MATWVTDAWSDQVSQVPAETLKAKDGPPRTAVRFLDVSDQQTLRRARFLCEWFRPPAHPVSPVTCTQLSRTWGALPGVQEEPLTHLPGGPTWSRPHGDGVEGRWPPGLEKARWLWGSGLLLGLTCEDVAALGRACPVGQGLWGCLSRARWRGTPHGSGSPPASLMSL